MARGRIPHLRPWASRNCHVQMPDRQYWKVLIVVGWRCRPPDERQPRGLQHFLNFLPLPQGQGSLRPARGPPDDTGAATGSAGSPSTPMAATSSSANPPTVPCSISPTRCTTD